MFNSFLIDKLIAYRKLHPAIKFNIVSKSTSNMLKMIVDDNVICFGQKFIAEEDAIKIFNAFVNTDFEGGRHLRRISKY